MKTFWSLIIANVMPLSGMMVMLAVGLYKKRRLKKWGIITTGYKVDHWLLWLAIFAAVFCVCLVVLHWLPGSGLMGR